MNNISVKYINNKNASISIAKILMFFGLVFLFGKTSYAEDWEVIRLRGFILSDTSLLKKGDVITDSTSIIFSKTSDIILVSSKEDKKKLKIIQPKNLKWLESSADPCSSGQCNTQWKEAPPGLVYYDGKVFGYTDLIRWNDDVPNLKNDGNIRFDEEQLQDIKIQEQLQIKEEAKVYSKRLSKDLKLSKTQSIKLENLYFDCLKDVQKLQEKSKPLQEKEQENIFRKYNEQVDQILKENRN